MPAAIFLKSFDDDEFSLSVRSTLFLGAFLPCFAIIGQPLFSISLFGNPGCLDSLGDKIFSGRGRHSLGERSIVTVVALGIGMGADFDFQGGRAPGDMYTLKEWDHYLIMLHLEHVDMVRSAMVPIGFFANLRNGHTV